MPELTYRPPHRPLAAPGGMDLHLRDMTATFAADVPLRFAQWRLQEHGQWLPVDGDPNATLGALVEQNSTGPLRLGYGAWRDLLLGMQFTNGGGELITAGGRTVKNVAGYDLTKFMVGQGGVFGKPVTITARTYRRPDAALLSRHPPDVKILSRMLPTPLRPQWAVLTPDALLCGYLADEVTLDWYEANVRSAEPAQIVRRSIQEDIEHRASLWKPSRPNVLRVSVPPSRVHAFAQAIGPLPWAADAAFGIVLVSIDSELESATVRDAAAVAGGSIVGGGVGSGAAASASAGASVDPVQKRIIEGLKNAFDPEGRLSPLPWQYYTVPDH